VMGLDRYNLLKALWLLLNRDIHGLLTRPESSRSSSSSDDEPVPGDDVVPGSGNSVAPCKNDKGEVVCYFFFSLACFPVFNFFIFFFQLSCSFSSHPLLFPLPSSLLFLSPPSPSLSF
jgi:hypothetical protein